jgi:hypothetical protein
LGFELGTIGQRIELEVGQRLQCFFLYRSTALDQRLIEILGLLAALGQADLRLIDLLL